MLDAPCPLRLCLLCQTAAGLSPSFPKWWLSSFFRVGIEGFFKPGSVLGSCDTACGGPKVRTPLILCWVGACSPVLPCPPFTPKLQPGTS